MKKKLGNFLLILGAVSLIVALVLYLNNLRIDSEADQAASNALSQIQQMMGQEAATEPGVENLATEPSVESEVESERVEDPRANELPIVDIDGYGYIGYLTFPTLDLQLPVMSQWDYARLKISPCYYFGSLETDDLVIAGHNYTRHFGPLNSLELGDSVIFTNMLGISTAYEVVESTILAPTAIEEMTSGEFDLSLYTCTLGGKSRVTIRCNRVETK